MQNFLFIILLLYIWIGYILNAILPVSYFDEIVEVLFIGLLLMKNKSTEFLIFIGAILFYLIYSWSFSTNPVTEAIILDALQQAKPFVFFYTFYTFNICLSSKKRKWIKFCVIIGVIMSIGSYIYDNSLYSGLYRHPATYGISMFCFSILYYFCSNKTKKDKIITLLILVLGLLSLRAKYYGEFIIAIVFLFVLRDKIKFNIKYIVWANIIVLIILFFVSYKISLYFNSEDSARFVLYNNFPKLLMDYFPFGSGFASYGTYFSGKYYSPLYDALGMNHVWGLSRDNFEFIADTYFPSLAQEGVCGVALFLIFWKRRFNSIKRSPNKHHYILGFIIISFLFIESIAGSAFVMVYNYIPLLLLSTICKESDNRATSHDK